MVWWCTGYSIGLQSLPVPLSGNNHGQVVHQTSVVYPPTGSRPTEGRWAPCQHSSCSMTYLLGYMPGTYRSGRQRIQWLENVKDWAAESLPNMVTLPRNRRQYRKFINRIPKALHGVWHIDGILYLLNTQLHVQQTIYVTHTDQCRQGAQGSADRYTCRMSSSAALFSYALDRILYRKHTKSDEKSTASQSEKASAENTCMQPHIHVQTHRQVENITLPDRMGGRGTKITNQQSMVL